MSSIIGTVLAGLMGVSAATGASYVVIVNIFTSLAFIYILLQAIGAYINIIYLANDEVKKWRD